MIGWMMPEKTQPKGVARVKILQIGRILCQTAGRNAAGRNLGEYPRKTRSWGEKEQKAEPESQTQKGSAQKTRRRPGDDAEELFDKLARPQIKKSSGRPENASKPVAKNSDGYNKNERDNLDRLIENTIE